MTENTGFAAILEQFEAIEYFPGAGEMRLKAKDGRELSAPGDIVPETPIVRSALTTDGRSIELEFDSGELVVLDLPPMPPVPDTRPVVYLDQNHWVELARVRVASKGIDPERAKVYGRFTELANSGAIILPLSSAHFTELGRKSGQQRRDVAITMLQLSRGWQMRNPIQIRAEELELALNPAMEIAPVFTLEPNSLWTETRPPRVLPTPGDVAAEASALASDLSTAAALADVLASTNLLESDEGLAIAERWAASFADLAQHIRSSPKARSRLRQVSLARLITDMADDIATAAARGGLTPEQFQTWLTDEAEGAFATLPAQGRIREVIHRRLSNADDKWERNDLYDLLFLSTAGGYADVVVAEKKLGNYLLQSINATTPGAQVFVRMTDALAAMEWRLERASGEDG